jgi:ElaB/YqjD/DUF883 family membrane-anchored ribosome-binding protein
MGQGTEELNTEIEGTREDLSRNLDALTDKVSPQRIVDRRKEAARGKMRGIKDKVMGTTTGAKDKMVGTTSGAKESVTGTAQDAMGTIEEKTEGNPLAAGLIAFGAGMLISAMMPASQKEADAAHRLVEAAKEHGGPVIEEAKSMGQEMGENLKESAKGAVQEVQSTAAESASHVKQEGQSSAQQVKEDTQQRMQ